MTLSDRIKHFFHVISNVRPIVWICTYIGLTPVFALIYWWLPDAQFRIPDGAPTDFGSWLYYSIVTITTLGFGDYTPAHGWAQTVTAVEVMCGLTILGFFLNAVGSMKSEIDVESAIEKQRRLHQQAEADKLTKASPTVIRNIDNFLAYAYAVTTPLDKRSDSDSTLNSDFNFADMADMFSPSGLPTDRTGRPAVESLLRCASRTSLCIDTMQTNIDLTLWPVLLEDSFSFVAEYQMFSSEDNLTTGVPDAATRKEIVSQMHAVTGEPKLTADSPLAPEIELYHYLKTAIPMALNIKKTLQSL